MDNPAIPLIIWQTFYVIGLLIFGYLIYLLIKYLRKKTNTKIFWLVLPLVFLQCEFNREQDSDLTQDDILAQLGVDSNTVTYENIENAKSTIPIHFTDINEAKDFIKKAQAPFNSETNYDVLTIVHQEIPEGYFNRVQSDPCEQGVATVSLENQGYGTNYDVTFSYSTDSNGNLVASNINSHISGFTMGVSWTHVNSSYTPGSSQIDFQVQGYQNYNLFVEGVGTVYSQGVTLIGTFKPCLPNGGGSYGRLRAYLTVACNPGDCPED